MPGLRTLAPVPSKLDQFDVRTAASRFRDAYPMIGEQGAHDLTRLLQTAVKAGEGTF
jgi:hypothetical protein